MLGAAKPLRLIPVPSFMEQHEGRRKVARDFSYRTLGAGFSQLTGWLRCGFPDCGEGCRRRRPEGKVILGARARLVRDHAVVAEGRVTSLRHFKEDAREVTAGYECGLRLEGCDDVRAGDVVEAFDIERVTRRLPAAGVMRKDGAA
jgi:hypothetical protein